MKDLFNRTKMMNEAKIMSKPHTPIVETLIFIAVFYISNVAQYILLASAIIYYAFTNPELLSLLSSATEENISMVYEKTLEMVLNMPEWLFMFSVFISFVVIVTVFVYCKFIEKRSISSLGIRKANIFFEMFVGLFAGALMISLIALMCEITDIAIFSINGIDFKKLILYFIAFMIKGFSTVLLVWGYYMISVSKSTNVTYALFTSSFLYATLNMLSYFDILYFVNSLMIGLLMGLFVIKRGNIWAAAVFNGAWNFTSLLIFGVDTHMIELSSVMTTTFKSGFDSLSGGQLGFEAGLITTLIVFAVLGIMYIIPQNNNEIYEETINETEN